MRQSERNRTAMRGTRIVSWPVAVALLTATACSPGQGAQRQPSHDELSLKELSVERINVREPDGKLRMVITNEARTPPLILSGQKLAVKRSGGGLKGILFYNDEETECGGLVYEGQRKDGQRLCAHRIPR